jgi:hypothetical protein
MLAKPYHRPLDGDRSGFLENEPVSVIGDRANAGAGAHRRRRYDPVPRQPELIAPAWQVTDADPQLLAYLLVGSVVPSSLARFIASQLDFGL